MNCLVQQGGQQRLSLPAAPSRCFLPRTLKKPLCCGGSGTIGVGLLPPSPLKPLPSRQKQLVSVSLGGGAVVTFKSGTAVLKFLLATLGTENGTHLGSFITTTHRLFPPRGNESCKEDLDWGKGLKATHATLSLIKPPPFSCYLPKKKAGMPVPNMPSS